MPICMLASTCKLKTLTIAYAHLVSSQALSCKRKILTTSDAHLVSLQALSCKLKYDLNYSLCLSRKLACNCLARCDVINGSIYVVLR